MIPLPILNKTCIFGVDVCVISKMYELCLYTFSKVKKSGSSLIYYSVNTVVESTVMFGVKHDKSNEKNNI